jgi:hypothetical protein
MAVCDDSNNDCPRLDSVQCDLKSQAQLVISDQLIWHVQKCVYSGLQTEG